MMSAHSRNASIIERTVSAGLEAALSCACQDYLLDNDAHLDAKVAEAPNSYAAGRAAAWPAAVDS